MIGEEAGTWESRSPRMTAFVLAIVAATGCMSGAQIECEEARAHLASCCPRLNAKAINCEPSSLGGCATPQISVDDSRRLQDLTCDQIRAQQQCALPFLVGSCGHPPAVQDLRAVDRAEVADATEEPDMTKPNDLSASEPADAAVPDMRRFDAGRDLRDAGVDMRDGGADMRDGAVQSHPG